MKKLYHLLVTSYKLRVTSFFLFLFPAVSMAQITCDDLPDIFVDGCVPDLDNFDTNFTIALRYESNESDICLQAHTFVGDIDGDGFSEIIALINTTGNPQAQPNGFRIYDYQAKVKKEIPFPDNHVMNYSFDFYAICDLDNDGKSEIIMTTRDELLFQYYLRVYDCEGNLTVATIAGNMMSYFNIIKIGVADFDNDGLPEIYFGENIYKYTPGTLT
ncbi:MAG: VCBS repeat-containing protein, partial [Lentimicrobiaceae bacterium]|nr:VCBS repeat-containing protein [Lentimicrobiaceae bacterium]